MTQDFSFSSFYHELLQSLLDPPEKQLQSQNIAKVPTTRRPILRSTQSKRQGVTIRNVKNRRNDDTLSNIQVPKYKYRELQFNGRSTAKVNKPSTRSAYNVPRIEYDSESSPETSRNYEIEESSMEVDRENTTKSMMIDFCLKII